jgi:hypothetical protein
MSKSSIFSQSIERAESPDNARPKVVSDACENRLLPKVRLVAESRCDAFNAAKAAAVSCFETCSLVIKSSSISSNFVVCVAPKDDALKGNDNESDVLPFPLEFDMA